MRKTLTIALILFAVNFSFAGTISEQAAKNVAVNFFKGNAGADKSTVTATLKYTQKESDNTVDFYVFDISPKGFVIVSAADNVSPVIAYSAEANFSSNFKKTGISTWMNHAAKNVHTAILHHVQPNANISSLWTAYAAGQNAGGAKSAGLKPLILSSWNQDDFYNQYCPYNSADHQRCLTGCVATSMAQIMKFWNYPAKGTGSYSYNNSTPNYPHNYGVQSANFGATTYSWDSMPLSVNAPNKQISTLMYQCGVAVSMSYGDDNQGGSGAYVLQSDVPSWKHSAEYAFKNYFSYNPNTLKDLHSADYTSEQWITLIKNELNLGHPIQYIGLDTLYGGHAWICDGYDQNDMLHMNWGWGGDGNGYYSVSNLSIDGFNFSNEEGALIGIVPNNIKGTPTPVIATVSKNHICSGESTTLNAKGSSVATYTWEPTTGLECPTCSITVAHPLTSTVYTITMDSAGYKSHASVTIKVSTAMVVTAEVINDVTCFGGSNGSIGVTVTGGSPSYMYSWNNGQSTSHATNLSKGTYTVTVHDAAGCSSTAAQTISQPEAVRVAIKASNGNKVVANVTGGSGTYFFLWSNGSNEASVSGPSSGSYKVTVTDSHNCTTTSSSTSVSQQKETGLRLNEDNNELNIDAGLIGAENEGAIINNDGITFDVYPNPAKNLLNVKLGSLNSDVTISVRNIIGENLCTRSVSSLNTQLDLSSFSGGIYFISLSTNGHSFVRQFVISR